MRSRNGASPLIRTVSSGGLETVLWPEPGNPRAALYVVYPVGSRLELPEPTGLAHFLEHMMFNGSTHFPDGAFDRILEDLGGSNNAYTTEEITVYQDLVPAGAIGRVLELEADRRRNLLIDPERVDRERGVILSERQASVDNDPVARFLEEVQAVAFAGTSYATPVIGWRDDIERIDSARLQKFYTRHYQTGTPVIVGVGGIDPDDWHRMIDAYWSPDSTPPPSQPSECRGPGAPFGERRIEVEGPLTAPYLVMGFPAPEASAPSAPAHEILWTLLVGGVASRLYAMLVEGKSLALDLETFRVGTRVPGRQFLGVTVSPRRRIGRVEQAIREELARIVEQGPTAAERERALNQRLASHAHHLESVAGRAELLARALVIQRDPDALAAYPTRLGNVSLEDIRHAAETAFGAGGWTVGALNPQHRRVSNPRSP
ncbi:zinc protease [mine drainage metagenome]|uniref:Zinc protease n=3 Tax=mine drainage metagenome TaxID=410659 RepID=T1D4G6_9ZZZZ